MAYKAEVEALRKQLSEKEEKVQDLSAELSCRARPQRRESQRLKDRAKVESVRSKLPCKNCSESDILAYGPVVLIIRNPGVSDTASPSSRPISQAATPASQSKELVQGHFLSVRFQTSCFSMPAANNDPNSSLAQKVKGFMKRSWQSFTLRSNCWRKLSKSQIAFEWKLRQNLRARSLTANHAMQVSIFLELKCT
jgi:hypothetical protein